LLRSELGFTIPLLIEFPKCYWIWNYRRWVLQQAIDRLAVPTARKVWEEELGLVGKMLAKDRRNFHAWGYRRHVVARLESRDLDGRSMVETEFEYTTKMIRVDLSNFSAWHNRSQLITRLLEQREANDEARRRFLDDGEFCRGWLVSVRWLTERRAMSHPGGSQRWAGGPVALVLSPVPHAQPGRIHGSIDYHA
jgi:Protein prenyltransferase alpha subunit repeat